MEQNSKQAAETPLVYLLNGGNLKYPRHLSNDISGDAIDRRRLARLFVTHSPFLLSYGAIIVPVRRKIAEGVHSKSKILEANFL